MTRFWFYVLCSLSISLTAGTESDAPPYEFDFTLTWESSMIYTDDQDVQWAVQLEDGKLFYTAEDGVRRRVPTSNVTTLDGVMTKYIAINGQLPGPTIEVPLGATVYVHVHNELLSESATLHWHGLTMRDNQWADGSPYVSQCPIPPGTSFTYRFKADEAGTFWYHSHMDMQRMDGLFGAVIVHDTVEMLPSHQSVVLVNDWLHIDSTTYKTTLIGPPETEATYTPIPDRYDSLYDEAVGDLASDSFLINGRGRYENNSAPLTVHRAKQGEEHLFRFINTGFDNLLEVSIDYHKMKVVATDSCSVEPVEVDSVFLAVGERVNVLVMADQPINNYWVRYRAPHKAQTNLGYSILSYTDSSEDPNTGAKQCLAESPCVALNCPFSTAPNWSCIPISDLKSTRAYTEEIDKFRSNSDVSEHFLAYSYMAGDTINGRALDLPTSPFYQSDYGTTGTRCDEEVCNVEGCSCTHVRKLPSQLVVTHLVLKHFIHTWHMHGYRFAVVKVVYPPKNETTQLISRSSDIVCSNDLCYDAHWSDKSLGFMDVDRPPLKDTVLIPVGGYAVVRFYTDNPGYWMGHCHQTEHLHEGMAMIFDVDGDSVKTNIPMGFPQCGNFMAGLDVGEVGTPSSAVLNCYQWLLTALTIYITVFLVTD